MSLSPDLLRILVCPCCRGELREEEAHLLCRTPDCGLRFSIREGIPVLEVARAGRPCPSCGAERDWKEEALICPKCGATFRPGGPPSA